MKLENILRGVVFGDSGSIGNRESEVAVRRM